MIVWPLICRYDGQRAQIHLQPDGSVRIFSRNGDDSTSRFPDVSDIVRAAMQPQTSSFIIDAEVTMDTLLSLSDDFWFWLGHWLSELLSIVWLSVSPQVHVIVGWRAFELQVVAVNRENGNKLMAFQHLSTRERGTRDGGIINVQNIKVRLIILFWCALFSQMTLVGSASVTLPCLKVCRDILSHI